MRAALHTLLALIVGLTLTGIAPVAAQNPPPRIVIGPGVIEPMPIAIPTFIDEGGAGDYAREIGRVVQSDLEGTGFFRTIGEEAYISRVTGFDSPVAFEDWKAINAQVLITGAVSVSGDRITVKFRAYDVFNGQVLEGAALQFGWRTRWRMWSIPRSPARAGISTAGWCSSARAVRRTSG
jgi:TolB protein